MPGQSWTNDLRQQAVEFATDLTRTVQAVVPDAAPFSVIGREVAGKTLLSVMQDPAEGIRLAIESVPLLRLSVSFHCVYDHRQRYLAVEQSSISVRAIPGSSEPLLRYEYVRNPQSTMAGAHLQIHAHRDAITYVMAQSGQSTKRGRRRSAAATSGERIPQLSDLHLPLGGPRFRPCLEDVLQMLIDELGIDAPPTAKDALATGRARWRRMQISASVRDCPEAAARVLTDLGYTVMPPEAGPVDERVDRLTVL